MFYHLYRQHFDVHVHLLAEQVKKIKNKATVNESATDALIRQLREENSRLMGQLKSGNFSGQDENVSKEGTKTLSRQ